MLNNTTRRVLYTRWLFEKKERAGLSDQVSEMKKQRKATEKEIAGLWKSLLVELGERRKLVDLRATHNAKLDELDRASLVVQSLKKDVKGLQKELRGAEESSVAVLKLSHQKELQDLQMKSKIYELELGVQKKVVASLEATVKLAEGEASKLRSKMDDILFGSAKSSQTL